MKISACVLPVLYLGLALSASTGLAAPVESQDLDDFLRDKGLLNSDANVFSSTQNNPKMAEVVVHAMGFMGVPYKRGGNSAESGGLDCSGFVKAVYEDILGLHLPRNASQQAQVTQTIEAPDLQPGDLVFYNTMKRSFSHVGIYVGAGKFVHSPKPGAGVRLEDMALAYWIARFNGARRVIWTEGKAAAPLRMSASKKP